MVIQNSTIASTANYIKGTITEQIRRINLAVFPWKYETFQEIFYGKISQKGIKKGQILISDLIKKT